MAVAPFSAQDVNSPRAAVEGSAELGDGSRVRWALSRREFGPMSFSETRPEWDVAHNRMQFLRIWDYSIDRVVAPALDHTGNVAVVDSSDARKGARERRTGHVATDGVVTRDTDLVLMTTHADCLPVWLLSPSTGWIGIAHAGWRGLVSGIVQHLVEAVPEEAKRDVHLSIGPGIGVGHYEVGEEVAERFRRDEILAPAVTELNGRPHVNMLEGAVRQGEAAGATVDTSAFADTFEHEHLSSFRRDKLAFAPMAAFIVREPAV